MPDQARARVYLDDQSCDPAPPPPATLQELVRRLYPRLNAAGRMIVGIACDHQAVADADIDRVLERPLADFQRVDLTSAPITEVALGALQAAETLFEQARTMQQQVLEHLTEDRADAAIAGLSDCVMAWSMAHQAVVDIVHIMRLDIDNARFGDRPISDILHLVASQLVQVRDSLKVRDYVLLADLLRYEIIPGGSDWQGVIAALRTQIGAAPPPGPQPHQA